MVPGGHLRGRATALLCALSTALIVALAFVSPTLADHSFTVSTGIYRIPYADGTTVTVTRDHHDHAPAKDRVDMVGTGGGPYTIVAAQTGVIRAIVDFNGDDPEEHSCTDDTTVEGDCQDYNNYVWIEHANGEWTKYSHMETGSTTALGRFVGELVAVGTPLGIESDVGAATGPHLHTEGGIPDDPDDPTPFSTLGGFLQGDNIVLFICDIPDNLYETGEDYTANPCTGDVVAPVVNVEVVEHTPGGDIPYDFKWTNNQVSAYISCDDGAGSGVIANHYPSVINYETDTFKFVKIQGVHSCWDAYGNLAGPPDLPDEKVKVDRHAPVCSVSPILQSVPKNAGNFYTRSVNVSSSDGAFSGEETVTLLSVTTNGLGSFQNWDIGSSAPHDEQGKFQGTPNAVYTVTYEVSDRADNTSQCSAKVKTSRY